MMVSKRVRWGFAVGCLVLLTVTLALLTKESVERSSALPDGLNSALPRGGLAPKIGTSLIMEDTPAASEPVLQRMPDELADEVPDEGVAGFATLDILVVSSEDAEPLPGTRLMLLPASAGAELRIRYASDHVGTPRDVLLTDANGKATFKVPALQRLELKYWGEDESNPRAKKLIRELDIEERRSIEVPLVTRLNRVSHGRVVHAQGESPVVGAEVTLRSKGRVLRTTHTDSNGLFWLWRHSSMQGYLRIEAEGLTPALVPVETETRISKPVPSFELLEGASVRFAISDQALLPAALVTCRLSVRPETLVRGLDPQVVSQERFRYACQTDQDGRGLCSGLPASVPLDIVIHGQPDGIHPLRERPVVKPGQSEEVVFRLPPRLELHGSLSDQRGKPIAGQEIWIVSSESQARRYLNCHDCDCVRVRSGADGRFFATGLPEGPYLVGPSPDCAAIFSMNCPRSSNVLGLAHVGTPLLLRQDFDNQVDLIVDRDLHLSGRVVDQAGRPVHRARVSAELKGIEGASLQVISGRLGQFSLPNLIDGSWSVRAWSPGSPTGLVSSTRFLRPGGDPIEITVEKRYRDGMRESGGGIRGAIVNRITGQLPEKLSVSIQPTSGEAWATPFSLDTDPHSLEFQFDDLAVGTYRIWLAERWGGASQLVSIPFDGARIEGVELPVEPLATVRLVISEQLAGEQSRLLNGHRLAWTYCVRVNATKVIRGVFWDRGSPPIATPDGFVEATVTEFDTGHERVATGLAVLDEALLLTY